MGRIIAQVKISNPLDQGKDFEFSALVDTGASYLTLPTQWKEKLGQFSLSQKTRVILGDESAIEGEICGPVQVEVDQFRPIHTEVLFIPMQPQEDGKYQPLLGYIPLESIPVAVDMLGHGLVAVKGVDCK